MRFTIVREELLKGLNIVSRAVSNKSVVPSLSNVKIELNEKGLFLTGSNLDLSIQTFVPFQKEEKVIIRNYKEGTTLINAKIITEIVRKLDCEELVFDVIDSTIAVISNNQSEYKINCMRAEEYPDLDLEPTGVSLTLATADFDDLVNQTAFAASTKEQRPILTAVNLDALNGVLTATTTDSARLARKQLPIPEEVNFVANIPSKMIVEVEHLLDNAGETIDIALSDKKALFSIGTTIVATRLIAGDYPNTKNIIPRSINYSLEVNASDLMKAIDRANVLSIDRENVVDLTMSGEGVEISSTSSQVGSAIERIDVFKYEGSPLRISFNSDFVLSAVRALKSEDVVFQFVGEMKPFVIKNALDDSIVQIVTPVRTY